MHVSLSLAKTLMYVHTTTYPEIVRCKDCPGTQPANLHFERVHSDGTLDVLFHRRAAAASAPECHERRGGAGTRGASALWGARPGGARGRAAGAARVQHGRRAARCYMSSTARAGGWGAQHKGLVRVVAHDSPGIYSVILLPAHRRIFFWTSAHWPPCQPQVELHESFANKRTKPTNVWQRRRWLDFTSLARNYA